MINWKNISDTEFEELIYILLEKNNFVNLSWYGKSGGDKGRDITAEKSVSLIGNKSINQKWLCQCKRYTEKKLTKTELSEILNAAKEHKIDYVLLAITDTLTPDKKDWLDSQKDDYKFNFVVWEDIDLRREIAKNLVEVSERFPAIIKQNEIIRFYDITESGKKYICSEFEEVGFHILNDYGRVKNIEYIKEFIQYIRNNDVDFDVNTGDV